MGAELINADRQTNGRTDGPDDANTHFFFASKRKRKCESGNFVTRLAPTDTHGLLDCFVLSSAILQRRHANVNING